MQAGAWHRLLSNLPSQIGVVKEKDEDGTTACMLKVQQKELWGNITDNYNAEERNLSGCDSNFYFTSHAPEVCVVENVVIPFQ